MTTISTATMLLLLAIIFCCSFCYVGAFTSPTTTSHSKNALILNGMADTRVEFTEFTPKTDRRAFLMAATALTTSLVPTVAFAAAAGGGGGDSDNAFIQELKSRSDANREQYNQQARNQANRLDSAQFQGQYQRPTYIGIRKADGTYQMVTLDVAKSLQAKGLVIAKYDTYYDEKKGAEIENFKKGKVLQYSTATAQAEAEALVGGKSKPSTTAPVAEPEPVVSSEESPVAATE